MHNARSRGHRRCIEPAPGTPEAGGERRAMRILCSGAATQPPTQVCKDSLTLAVDKTHSRTPEPEPELPLPRRAGKRGQGRVGPRLGAEPRTCDLIP